MTQREDLLGRLTELDAGQEAHRSTARSIQKMINHGDYAGATTALDDLETALHPALAAGGGGSLPAVVVHDATGDTINSGDDQGFPRADLGWTIDQDDLDAVVSTYYPPPDDVTVNGEVVLPAGLYVVGGYADFTSSPDTGHVRVSVLAGPPSINAHPNANISDGPWTDFAGVDALVFAPSVLVRIVEGSGDLVLHLDNVDVSPNVVWTSVCMWALRVAA